MSKGKWRPKEVREIEKRDREIRRERRELKRVEKEERRKRRATKATLRAELDECPKNGPDNYKPTLKCRDCGGGMIVSMLRDPETGDNQPICERCN